MWSISCYGADPQREMQEACSLVAQQRNSLSDAIAVAEARRKMESEEAAKVRLRLADWEAYFKAYVGEEK